jgi:hypothetical protein
VQRWRYHSIVIRDLSISDAKLNAEGERGWELVSIFMVDSHTARAYFKIRAEDLPETALAMESVMASNPFE